jgi:hypothetical protein
MTSKCLHDHHIAQLAWRARRSSHDRSGDGTCSGHERRAGITERFFANQTWE